MYGFHFDEPAYSGLGWVGSGQLGLFGGFGLAWSMKINPRTTMGQAYT